MCVGESMCVCVCMCVCMCKSMFVCMYGTGPMSKETIAVCKTTIGSKASTVYNSCKKSQCHQQCLLKINSISISLEQCNSNTSLYANVLQP